MICCVLFVSLILFSVLGGASAAYKPTDVFLFNCGGTYDQLDNKGRYWIPESSQAQEEFLRSGSVNASFPSIIPEIEPSIPQVPFMTARIFRSNFTYSFHVSPGWEFLRLYFYPTRYGSNIDAVNSFFSVTVNNNFTLLRDFSPGVTVKASKSESKYLIKEFIVPVYQILNLTFTPSPNLLAFVNGIEIVSMPDRFYSKGGFDNVITNVGSTIDFKIDNTTVLETVYRLNVGAEMVDGIGDSGLFRRWLSDDEYIPTDIINYTGITPIVQDSKINYTTKTPAYVAPEAVYATSRTMYMSFNMTWLFPVDAGFNYLVRLHLCENYRGVNKAGQRVFSIFLDNQMATLEMDVFKLSGGSWTPIYLDYNVSVGFGSGPRHNLRLDLHPLKVDNPNLKLYAILNGVEILKLNNPDGNLAGPSPNLIGSTNSTLDSTPDSTPDLASKDSPLSKGLHYLVIAFIATGSATGLATILFWIRKKKRKNRKKNNSVIMSKVLLKHYTYTELKKITKSFSHTVGKGGFGTVYEGNLSNGRKVAVKVLKDSTENGEDFINEVASMSQTSHVNIVSLLGFCYEGSKRAIVSEFLENGSLHQFITMNKSLPQDVTTLYGISLGIARGLEYLHYGCKTRIVHFDIKPENILLDENLFPKVSDFGLAKLCEKRESNVSLIGTRGTIGYTAPELFSRMYGSVSHKSDVYSYGMLLLEIIGARNKEIAETSASNASSIYFPDWIYEGLEKEKQPWIHGDEITEEEKHIGKKITVVGLWCIQQCPSDRPSMNRVVEMMEGSLDDLEVPPKPSMHVSTRIIPESSSLSDEGEVR